MPFDLTDAYMAILELNEKYEYMYKKLVEKGIMPKEEKKDEKNP